MDRIFTDLKCVPKWGWFSLLALVVLMTLACSGAFVQKVVVLLVVAAFVCGTLFVAPAILNAAKHGHKAVPTVCVWTGVWLLGAVSTFFFWYFRWLPPGANESYDRIVNVVPVLTAIVAAGLGWYVHYQFSAKTQRTNTSFALIMEMQKSSEYLSRSLKVSEHFPPSTSEIPDEYTAYFSPGAEKRIRDQARQDGVEPDPIAIERAQAIVALRYVLNFYEFMAAGVRSNDLDCDLLLETVSEVVIGRFNRAKKLVDHIRQPVVGQGQELAFEHLEIIVRDWSHQIEERKSVNRKRKLNGHPSA